MTNQITVYATLWSVFSSVKYIETCRFSFADGSHCDFYLFTKMIFVRYFYIQKKPKT